ncbi:MAG: D-alanine--D-alanine ligase [Clostridia bacterium]|nr:D-alanine--D-alanine ligase [Clostridia bacterium]
MKGGRRLKKVKSKRSLLCLFGGRSREYEVSLMSASSMIAALDRELYDVHTVGITKDGKWYLYSGDLASIADGSWADKSSFLADCLLSPSYGERVLFVRRPGKEDLFERLSVELVFPMVHGAFSEDGTLQGLLSMTGIPYVGSGCTASAVAMDKDLTKQIVTRNGIPSASFLCLSAEELKTRQEDALARAESVSGYPLFVKPANGGSSIGASRVWNRAELLGALEEAAEVDYKILVEECIRGREVECAVLGNSDPETSGVGEIEAATGFYDYESKYLSGTSRLYIPARIRPETAQIVRDYAKRIFLMLGCRGLSRVDFFVLENADGTESVLFNEINALPGFTAISMYPKLWAASGIEMTELLNRLISLAGENDQIRPLRSNN